MKGDGEIKAMRRQGVSGSGFRVLATGLSKLRSYCGHLVDVIRLRSILMRNIQCILVLSGFLLSSCDTRTEKAAIPDTSDPAATLTSDTNGLALLDTTILLSGLERSNYKGPGLTDSLAKKVLYAHFTKKGYYTSENRPALERIMDMDNPKLCVDYFGMDTIDFNGNNRTDAVVAYWLEAPYANGNHLQLQKAVIVDTDRGYKVTNEEFIPEYYEIDSLRNENNTVILYGKVCDEWNHGVAKDLMVRLK